MSHNAHKVSAIVPIFNVERYLDQCLNSIEAQTFDDIEIVCVNDGSTDGSLAIMQAHAARDPRIIIIDKANEGYGASCNRGIRVSTGDYIAIVEPDDWIEPGMFGDLLAFADTLDEPIDIIESAYWRIMHPDTPKQRKLACSYKGRVRPSHQPFAVGDGEHLLLHHPSIWTALYRRSFLEEKGIRFREIPGAGWADNPFLVETLCQTDRIAYLDKAYYCYREDTIEKSLEFARRNVMLPLERWNDMMDILERIGETDPRVLRAQNKRGFTYAGTAIESVGIEHPGLAEAVTRMMERMDADLVMSDRELSPGQKRLFCKLTGHPEPRISNLSYAPELARQAFYHVKNNGIAFTLEQALGFLTRQDKRNAE